MHTTHLQFLTDKPENVYLEDSPTRRIERVREFERLTRLPSARVLTAAPVRIPLPVKQKSDPRWAGVAPDALRCPLFWLPDRIAYRYRDERGSVEDDVTWAIRVMLEVTDAKLYDPETALWVDMTDGADVSEIVAWRNGEPSALDTIDTEAPYANATLGDDEHWALGMATDMRSVLEPAQWALSARSIVAAVRDELANGYPPHDILADWAPYAARDLRTLTADPEIGVAPSELLDALPAAAGDPAANLVTMNQILEQVHDDYRMYYENFLED